jgi:starvation-inducible DNA-binding protein
MATRRGLIMANTDLIEKSKQCLADTFVMYMKAHAYHWNITGSNFPQLHDFFGKIYQELHGSLDEIAEQIRTLNSFAPFSLSRMVELSHISEDNKVRTSEEDMIKSLLEANELIMNCLTECYEMAEDQKEFAYSNFVQDRLTAHAKHKWMLSSILAK